MNRFAVVGISLGAAAALATFFSLASRTGGAGMLGKPGKKNRGKMKPDFEATGKGGQVLKGYRKSKMSIRERLELMQGLVAKDAKDPEMRKLALEVTSGCEARDDKCEAKAIYNYVKKNLRYTGDIGPHKLWAGGPVDSVDLYVTGKRALQNGGDDCDSHTITVSSLAILNGFTAKFKATSPYRWGRENYTHVYPLIGFPKNDPREWIAADTTLPGGDHFGEEAPHAKSFEVIA